MFQRMIARGRKLLRVADNIIYLATSNMAKQVVIEITHHTWACVKGISDMSRDCCQGNGQSERELKGL